MQDQTSGPGSEGKGGAAAEQFALAAAELAANTRCEEVVLLDLRGKSPVTEFFLIATGTSPRQMRTAVDEIRDLGKGMGFAAWRQDGYDSARWIVLDCVSVVVHLFDGESREFYDLELLWGDSPRIDWRKALGLPPALERAPRGMAVETEEEELTEEEEGAVMVELPDESTGSNSVEFVEAEPPSRRGGKAGAGFPTAVEEQEDETMEERAVGPLSDLPLAAASLDEEMEEIEAASRKKALKKKASKKKVVKKVVKKKGAKGKAGVKKAGTKAGKAKKVGLKKKAGAKKGAVKGGKKKG